MLDGKCDGECPFLPSLLLNRRRQFVTCENVYLLSFILSSLSFSPSVCPSLTIIHTCSIHLKGESETSIERKFKSLILSSGSFNRYSSPRLTFPPKTFSLLFMHSLPVFIQICIYIVVMLMIIIRTEKV